MRKIYLFLLAIAFQFSNAQDGSLDVGFVPPNNFFYYPAIADNTSVFTSLEQPGGVRVFRFLTSGQQDPGFTSQLFANSYLGGADNVNDIIVLPDGDILVAGNFQVYGGFTSRGIVRLNSDGSADTTFLSQLPVWFVPLDIEIQPGPTPRILVGGRNLNGGETFFGLNMNGTVNNNFDLALGTGPNGTVYSISTYADGRIIIGGTFTTFNGQPRNNLARLNATGALNAFTFNGINGEIYKTCIQNGTQIIVGGELHTLTLRQTGYFTNFRHRYA